MSDMPPPDHEKDRVERLREAMYSRKLSEQLHPRDRRELDQTHSQVGDDWKRDEPNMEPLMVAPVGIGIGKILLYWLLGAAIVFFIGAAGFFVYYFTIGGGSLPASPQNISIAISGPAQVAGGTVTELQIAVTNRNRIPLQNAELVIRYPAGTRSPGEVSSNAAQLQQCSGQPFSPANQDIAEQRICFGTLESGGSRQGTVSAIFVGEEGARVPVTVELEYHVTGSNSVYVASSAFTLNFTSAPISVSVDGAKEAISGQPVQLTLTVSSNAPAPIRDVVLNAQYPFGFKYSGATPPPEQNGFWELGDFDPGQQKTIVLNGTLTGDSGDARIFRFTSGTRSDATHTKVDTPLSVSTFKSTISQPFLKLALAINDSTNKTITVSPGDKVTVSVGYQNNLDVPVQNAVVVAKLSGMDFDGSTVRSSDGFYRSADGSVFWDKSTTGGRLETLSPGEKGSVSFTFQMPSSEELSSVQDPHLDISVNAAGARNEENGVPQTLQSTTHSTISLASDLELIAEGLYYTNPFGSSGPMPPKAGTETTYALVFTVTNTTNKVKDAVLTAQLPPYVRWVGVYSPASEDVTFNQLESTVTWKLHDIAPGVGLNGTQPRQAAIEVGMTPSTSQIGQEPDILQKIVLKGTDDVTGLSLTKAVDDITTNLTKVSKSSSEILVAGDPGFSATNATVVK